MARAKSALEKPLLRVVSLNLNGIRSAHRKGVFDWIKAHKPDVLCVQELKAQEPDMAPEMLRTASHQAWFHYAQQKGYSGVGVYSRHSSQATRIGFGSREFDAEGRYVRADFNGPSGALSVISLYLPSGTSSPERQEAKFRFLKLFEKHLKALFKEHQETGREFILCGDWNIAHHEIDLKNWRGNLKNSGFLPEERAWMTKVFGKLGFVDVYRSLYPEAGEEAYTWWSARGAAWDKNVGWRIDYQIATPGIAARAKSGAVYKKERFSDHAPLTVDYDWQL
jgi:exodeoxyribonuclease III